MGSWLTAGHFFEECVCARFLPRYAYQICTESHFVMSCLTVNLIEIFNFESNKLLNFQIEKTHQFPCEFTVVSESDNV